MADVGSIQTPAFDLSTAAILAARLPEAGLASLSVLPAGQSGVPGTAVDLLSQFALAADPGSEPPFLQPYRLGLQAAQSLESVQIDRQAAEDRAGPLRAQLIQDTQGFIATLPPSPSADPTQSSLFQAHLGAFSGQGLPGAGSLNQTLSAPASLRVTEATAGTAAQAFSEGQAPQEAISRQGVPVPPGTPAGTFAALDGLPPDYSPQGVPPVPLARIGTLLDLTG